MSKPGRLGPLANPALVEKNRNLDKHRHRAWENSVRAVLSTSQGRYFFECLVKDEDKCNAASSVFTTNGSLNAYQQGRQSVGSQLIQEAQRAGYELFIAAEAEWHQTRLEEQRARAAAHQPSSEEESADAD